jgi:ubiquinone/menaquinone biosynthesis C-methylase UbiE
MKSSEHEVLSYLKREYSGILNDEQIAHHYQRYVQFEQADELMNRFVLEINPRSKVLDIGCGYGSFVQRLLESGFTAIGVDTSKFEIEFAQNRLATTSLHDPKSFQIGDARRINLPDASVDVVTAWNVLEHVAERRDLLREIHRVLKPGGAFLFVCPNYASFRMEAHYQILWLPGIGKKLGTVYLKWRGRNPSFFQTSIFPITKRSIKRDLKSIGFKVKVPRYKFAKVLDPKQIAEPRLRKIIQVGNSIGISFLLNILIKLSVINPMSGGIELRGEK